MSIGLLFWVLVILTVLFNFIPIANAQYKTWGGYFLLIALIALLGWQVFGPALHR